MVGGIVVGVTKNQDGTTRIVVEGTGHDRHLEKIRHVKGHPDIQPGDSIWWQSRSVMWTPKGNKPTGPGQGTKWDIVLEQA